MEMKRYKEVATSSAAPSSPSNNSEEEEGSDNIKNSSFHAAKFSPRNASSKYDFVKVKVWLGDNADHYYVLSRFLLSRMLTVTKIPNHVAIKISLELKKLLIDNSLLDVSQSDLEANLFKLMERRGYGEEYINRYKMMTRFHHQRVPLVILVCGTACVGKSTLATQLAQRLNLPNVLQTDMVYELLRTSTDAPLTSTPVWARDFNSSEELIVEFCRECRIVRKGLAGDLKKAMKDGKPIIIEGIHLDPSIYLMDEGQKLPTDIPEKSKEPEPESVTSDDPARQVESNVSGSENHAEGSNFSSEPALEERLSDDQVNKALECQKSSDASGSNCPSEPASEERLSDDQVNKALDCQKSSDAAGSISEEKGKTVTNTEGVRKTSLRNEKGGAEPIIVPIVLDMAKFDHKALLEEWLSTRILGDNKWPVQDKDRLITNLKTIQDYLCSFKSQGGLTVVNISATTFPQTLDFLHGYLLQCIEQGISSGSSDNSKKPAET